MHTCRLNPNVLLKKKTYWFTLIDLWGADWSTQPAFWLVNALIGQERFISNPDWQLCYTSGPRVCLTGSLLKLGFAFQVRFASARVCFAFSRGPTGPRKRTRGQVWVRFLLSWVRSVLYMQIFVIETQYSENSVNVTLNSILGFYLSQ